jgi:hypothetical protein
MSTAYCLGFLALSRETGARICPSDRVATSSSDCRWHFTHCAPLACAAERCGLISCACTTTPETMLDIGAKNISVASINRAFRRLSVQVHPDKNPSCKKQAERKSKAASDAKEMLLKKARMRVKRPIGSMQITGLERRPVLHRILGAGVGAIGSIIRLVGITVTQLARRAAPRISSLPQPDAECSRRSNGCTPW